MSRAGIRSAIAWWRNSLPATIRPARNAPSASEMPARDRAQVVPKHTRKTVRMNSSRSRVLATKASSRGTRKLAATSTPARTATAVPTVRRISRGELSPPARRGTARIIGTTHRSWNTRMPTARRPCGASSSPRADSARRTTAVLETAITHPRNTAVPGASPNALARLAVHASVTATCMPPPSSTAFQRRRRRSTASSRPMPNSSSTTPTSASSSTWWVSSTRPRPVGPASTPVRMNPAIDGTPMRRSSATTTTAAPSTITRSLRKPSSGT